MKIIEPTKPKLPITTPKYKELKNVGSYTQVFAVIKFQLNLQTVN